MSSNLSAEHAQIVKEEQQLLLLVKKGLLILVAENKLRIKSDPQLKNIIEIRDSLSETQPEDVPAVLAQLERMVSLHSHQDTHNSNVGYNISAPDFLSLIHI